MRELLPAAAKVNLGLVVGSTRADGYHEIVTVMQRIDVCDRLELWPSETLEVEGFAGDTLVRDALVRLSRAAGVEARWRVRIEKRIPVSAGLGGGSADAAGALVLANRTLPAPLAADELRELAAELGSDVPFFVEPGPKLAEGAGERLTPVAVPQRWTAVVALPHGSVKLSTGDVYARYDDLRRAEGFAGRRAAIDLALLDGNLGALPPNDLCFALGGAPLAGELLDAGAFRADLTGAGPAVYGLFTDPEDAAAAGASLASRAAVWVARPVW
jgi:4-diphosphocytidyl-2-C-methyl-D-erythritol kinase